MCHLGKDGQVFACSVAHVFVFLHDKGNLPLKDREHAALGTEMLNKSALAEGRKERELMASLRGRGCSPRQKSQSFRGLQAPPPKYNWPKRGR